MRVRIVKTGSGDKTKRTSDEWQRLSPHVEVLDPDGWDRGNWQHSWYEELITHHEYQIRLGQSTLGITRQGGSLWSDYGHGGTR